ILHARNADEAAQLALELVRQDPRAQPQPDSALPRLTVVAVAHAATIPRTQPGFAFFPDPGSPS
ncbi:MAG: hypothetical protein OER21_12825, partial [Gemmatimonadota bacterium]|nr:hypothetical protein [Gemmatimonadota bacterium]